MDANGDLDTVLFLILLLAEPPHLQRPLSAQQSSSDLPLVRLYLINRSTCRLLYLPNTRMQAAGMRQSRYCDDDDDYDSDAGRSPKALERPGTG